MLMRALQWFVGIVLVVILLGGGGIVADYQDGTLSPIAHDMAVLGLGLAAIGIVVSAAGAALTWRGMDTLGETSQGNETIWWVALFVESAVSLLGLASLPGIVGGLLQILFG
jgi:hypothetical protein